MKNLIKLFSLSCLVALALTSCDKDPDNVIYEVLDYETGAILRTLSIDAAVYNSSEPNSEFIVQLEEQDGQDGGLFESIDLRVTLRDLSPDNGTTVVQSALIKTIPASDFAPGIHGLPRGTVSATYAEAFGAMGVSADAIAPGDVFIMETFLNLTDGRVFGPTSAGPSVTGGFFASPFQYNALITCSPQPGVYTIDMHDSFGDGWQTDDGNGGSGITVDMDGTIVEFGMCSPYGGSNAGTFLDGNASPPTGCTGPASTSFFDATTTVTIPDGTVSALWTFPGDRYGEISFEVYGPAGQLLLEVGLGEGSAGLLPVTLCATN